MVYLKVSEGLRELQWLHHDSFLLLIISDLRIAGQREVLPQRMSIKSIVCHDPPQVWMAYKEYSEQVIYLPLIPVRSIVEAGDARYRCRLVCVGLDPDSGIMSNAEQVVDDLKALVLCGVIDCRNVRYHSELGSGMIFQEGYDGNDARGRDVYCQFVFPY